MTVIQQRLMSVEEYLKLEETSELRHEYINGQLIEMPGEKKKNNKIGILLTVFFLSLLEEKGYSIYTQAVKVRIPNESRFYYPDVFITLESEDDGNEYVAYQPELVVEVISKSTRLRDTVDKYLDYTKIPSLKYYLVVDPDTPYITVHSKDENGQWEADAYSAVNSIIPLPLLGIELPLRVVYR